MFPVGLGRRIIDSAYITAAGLGALYGVQRIFKYQTLLREAMKLLSNMAVEIRMLFAASSDRSVGHIIK